MTGRSFVDKIYDLGEALRTPILRSESAAAFMNFRARRDNVDRSNRSLSAKALNISADGVDFSEEGDGPITC